MIDRSFEGSTVNSVNIDNFKAAYEATNRFIINNKQNIAIINVNDQLLTMHNRTKGYLQCLSDNNILINQSFIKQLKFSNAIKDVKNAVEEVVQNGADAILFTTNKLCFSGLEKLKEMGIAIPDDIAVISFDDNPAFRLFDTSITTIKQPIKDMCKSSIDILFDLIDKNDVSGPATQLKLKSSLILRDSCI